tara:strand:+ start:136 stop:753 length:618 start_codon:yes stop_codon:yes gene_type:complete
MKQFPQLIPIFPLSGVIYFPQTNLPLNIFEQRYLDLVNDTVKKDKLMGMIQEKRDGREIYKIGCLGKISEFKKSEDGRILINLTGITRFEILEEKKNAKLYREFIVDYKKFTTDLNPTKEDANIEFLMKKAESFFKKNGLLLNWREFEKLDIVQRINTLAMIAPITNEEKQKLLESISLTEKINSLKEIIEFYLHQAFSDSQTIQ